MCQYTGHSETKNLHTSIGFHTFNKDSMQTMTEGGEKKLLNHDFQKLVAALLAVTISTRRLL